jgi:hypothetical protein
LIQEHWDCFVVDILLPTDSKIAKHRSVCAIFFVEVLVKMTSCPAAESAAGSRRFLIKIDKLAKVRTIATTGKI